MKKIVIMATVLGMVYSSSVFAGPFTISNVTCTDIGASTLCSTSGVMDGVRTKLKQIETDINKGLPPVDGERYANGMANSAVLTSKGLGVDYASNIKLFTIGGSAGIAIDAGANGLSGMSNGAATMSGLGGSFSGVFGLNLGVFSLPKLGPIDFKKMIVFVNVGYVNVGSLVGKAMGEGGSVSGSLTTVGLNARYRVIPEVSLLPFGLFAWSGLDITSGINYSSMKIQLTAEFSESLSNNLGGGVNMSGNYNGTLTFGPDLGILTVPVDVSSGIRVLNIFRLYAGLGLDINLGYSEIAAKVPGKVSGSLSGGGNSSTVNADAGLDLSAKGAADYLAMRFFGGLQLDFSVLNIFVQYNTAITSGTHGVSMGARIYW
ncbi:MAG TPA: hypothetical protein PLY93_10205 [Turneriella sp.]|nr:hypothetical protein [Turneriella sp.]